MTEPGAAAVRRELACFLAAVFVGSVGGMAAGMLLAPLMADDLRGSLGLAVGTTLTGAAHARLVHAQPVRVLVPRVVVAVPLASAIIFGVHRLFTRP